MTLETPHHPLSFIILAFKIPHTLSNISQQKAPFISDPGKVISRNVWKDKTPPANTTISLAFEASTFSS